MKHLTDYDVAIGLARRAHALATTDPEVNFTLGMIYARLGDVANADIYLSTAREHGKERYLVQLQMAYARYTATWRNMIPASQKLLDKVDELLDASTIGEPYLNSHHRHNDEIERLRRKAHRAMRKQSKPQTRKPGK